MRDLRWDNLRFVLIFLVVLGHALELCAGQVAHAAYQAVYAFHMPAFVFLTGYFAKFRWRGVASLGICYLVFQTLYQLFAWGVLGAAQGPLTLDYLTPYWLMWYLMATVLYYLLTPLLARVPAGGVRVGVLAACVAVSLLAGYAPVGRFLTLGRFLAFLPCFAAGFFARRWVGERERGQGDAPADLFALARKKPAVTASVTVAVVGVVALQLLGVTDEALYCASSYEASGSNPGVRVLQLLAAAGFTSLLLACAPSKQVPHVTRIGQNTMPVYLLHGFVVRAVGLAGLSGMEGPAGIMVALALASALTFAFGWPILNKLVRFKLPDGRIRMR